jgi:RHS repeat-associated protein
MTVSVPVSGGRAVGTGQVIEIKSPSGWSVASVSDLAVSDASGSYVAATMRASANGRGIVITIDDLHHPYPLYVDPTWSSPSADLYAVGALGVIPVNPATGAVGIQASSGGEQMFIPPATTTGWVIYYGSSGTSSRATPLNLLTGAIGTSASLGSQYGVASAMSPNGQVIYMTNWDGTDVIGFSTLTGKSISHYSLPRSDFGDIWAAVNSPSGQTLWLAGPGSVVPINVATGVIGASISIPNIGYPNGLVMAPNGASMYVTIQPSGSTGEIVPINLQTDTAGSAISINVGNSGYGLTTQQGLALSPDGKTGYVVSGTSTLTPVNLVNDTIGTPISFAGLPSHEGSDLVAVATSSNGQTGYALNPSYGYLDPVNLSTGALGTPINVGGGGYLDDVAQQPVDTVYPQGTVFAADNWGGGSPSQQCQSCSSAVPATAKHGDPVDTSTGDFSETNTNLSIPGAGVPLTFTSTYDAQEAQSEEANSAPAGPLGYGWADNLNMSVAYNSSTQIATVTEENGAEITFSPCSGSTNFCPQSPRIEATLNQNTGGSWTFVRTLGNPVAFSFSSSGVLTQITDSGGDSLTSSSYSAGSGQTACPSGDTCTAWTSSASGREMVLAVNSAGQLVEVFDAYTTLAASFAFSGSGCTSWGSGQTPDLCSATDPGNIISTYTYDSGNSNPDLAYDMLTATPPAGASGQVTNQYNSSGQISQQTDPTGAVTTYSYAGTNSSLAGGTTTVTAFPDGTGSGEPTDVTLDTYSSGTLVQETTGYGTSAALTTTIWRDPTTLMPTAVIDGNGNTTGYVLDQFGNVLLKTDALGNVTRQAYTSTNQLWCTVEPAEYANGVTCPSTEPTSPPAPGASDPNAGATINFYNSAGLLTATTDALGNTATFSYTSGVSGVPNNLIYCAVDPVNYRASVTCPAYGAAHVTGTSTMTYDAAGDQLTKTDQNGHTTTYVYGYSSTLSGTPSSVTDPDGTVTSYTYNGAAEPTDTTASFGSFTSSVLDAYDTFGRKYCEVDALEAAQSVTCPASPPSPSSPPSNVTSIFYDADGRVIQTTNPLGGTSLTAYNGAGQVYCTVTPADYTSGTRCPSSEPTTPPTVGSDPYSGATIDTHDAAGHTTQVTNPLGGIKLAAYDPAGNLTQTTVESNNSTKAPNVVTAFTYTADDKVATTTVGSGGAQPETTVSAYDPDSNIYCSVSAKAYAQGTSAYQCPAWQNGWIATPPKAGSLYSSSPSSSQANNVTTAFYNADGKLVQSTTPDVATSISAFNAAGAVYCTSDPTNVGAYLSAHSGASYPYLCPATPPITAPTTATGYATTIYDHAGQPLSSTDADGHTTSNTYDPAGQVLTTTDPRGKVTTNCYYDQNGTGQCANGAPAGGGTGSSLFSTTTPATSADPSGEVTTYTNAPGGQTLTKTTPAGTATDTYDAAGDLLSTTYSGVASGYVTPTTTSETYNVDGTMSTMADATGTTTYGYDANGDVTSQALVAIGGLSNAALSFSYFTTGALNTVVYPSYAGHANPTLTYAYDPEGQMATATDWLGNEIAFAHDADNNTTTQKNDVSVSNPNGTSSTAFAFDNADLLNSTTTTVAQTCGGSETLTQSDSGSGGSRNLDGQLMADSSTYSGSCSGQTNTTYDYSYDTAGNIKYEGTSAQGSSPNNFAQDPSGDPTTFSTDVSGTTDTYTQAFDSAGEVTSQTPISGSGGTSSTYSYDTLGDQTATSGAAATSSTYSAAGQLATFTSGSTTTTYTDNGLGLVGATSSSVATSQFTWDNTDALLAGSRQYDLPIVLSDGTNDYVYGPAGTAVEQIALSSSSPTYVSYNASNQAWVATNQAGDETGFWGYDAYGSALFGSSQSPFGYAGQYTDAASGLSVDRSRYFQSSTGAFTTRDPAFSLTDTAYTYSGGDPVNGGDPSGLCQGQHGLLVPGPCHFGNPKWDQWAQDYEEAQARASGGFSITRGFEGLANFGAGIGNAVVSSVTLGHVHISVPFCNAPYASLSYGLGNAFGFALSFVGGGAFVDTVRGLIFAERAGQLGQVALDSSSARALTTFNSPIADRLVAQIGDRQMVMSQTAVDEFQSAVSRLAGPSETAAAKDLLDEVTIVADNPSAQVAGLQVTRNVGANDIQIFGTADELGIPIFTADRAFLGGANGQGVLLDAIVHPPVSFRGF